MDKIYNKLVRDKIPDIINNDNKNAVVKILNDVDYKDELEKKLFEEYNEVLNTTSSKERIEELADLYEIICCLSLLEGRDIRDVVTVADKKRCERGGFEKQIFLERVIDNE